jgi:NAD(P)-dependent dehydrogenase (short-subunit alcohol dehydrogenase family)
MAGLAGRRVLVTGAGSGLGRALALKFAAQGWQVACTDRDATAVQATLELVQKTGARGCAAALDVTSEAAFADVVARVARDFGGLDVLINNAGVATAGTVEDSPLPQWQWVLDINLLGCVRGARAAIPVLKAQRGGHIVNVASFAGIANPPALASYNVAKAAVISLSETLRFELAPHGIGVSVACPSFFKTALIDSSRAVQAPTDAATAPQMEKIVTRLMDNSRVTADDVAADIHRAVIENRFLVISHADARLRYHLKRLAPELFFRLAQKATRGFLERR